jgi:hypothetical protein
MGCPKPGGHMGACKRPSAGLDGVTIFNEVVPKKARTEVSSLKDLATSKASLNHFLDFPKYVAEADEKEKDEFLKATESNNGKSKHVHSIDRLEQNLQQHEKDVAFAKKVMTTRFADEAKCVQLKDVVKMLEALEQQFDEKTLPSVLEQVANVVTVMSSKAEDFLKLSLIKPWVKEYRNTKTLCRLEELQAMKSKLEITCKSLDAAKEFDEAVLKLFNQKKEELKEVSGEIFQITHDADETPLDIQHSQGY